MWYRWGLWSEWISISIRINQKIRMCFCTKFTWISNTVFYVDNSALDGFLMISLSRCTMTPPSGPGPSSGMDTLWWLTRKISALPFHIHHKQLFILLQDIIIIIIIKHYHYDTHCTFCNFMDVIDNFCESENIFLNIRIRMFLARSLQIWIRPFRPFPVSDPFSGPAIICKACSIFHYIFFSKFHTNAQNKPLKSKSGFVLFFL